MIRPVFAGRFADSTLFSLLSECLPGDFIKNCRSTNNFAYFIIIFQ
ncbi:hypothetical protein GBAG_1089 [Buttiauxella agrestis ATCC 33320]|uniref:Uncharacterized protein n=1 Tax=Buttiauxella agrestis ATCC 33320 TaxID=1006004 RepID=A0A085GG75_9ENTR|nr:hypothetical protein GBAG_1089 [Buttiauxella agrestis ATCC 33320]